MHRFRLFEQWHNIEDAEKLKRIEKFTQLVSAHDLTYAYSDDSEYYRRGADSYELIEFYIEKQFIDSDLGKQIWNNFVDKKIAKEFTHQFYWK